MPSNSWQAYTAGCKSCGGEGDLYRGYCQSCWEKWEAAGANHRCRIEMCPIGQILFSQATIADTFTDGTPLQDTVDLLLANPWMIEKIPYINVVDDGDRHISMDNRRLYAFRMAFEDDGYEVPVKRFASKEAYGAADFHRKATSVCGGHSVELRHHQTQAPHTETLDPPRSAKRFLLQKWKELRSSVGAVLSVQDGQVVISGSQRQVEDGIKHYQRILSTFHCEAVDLKDVRAKDAVRSSFQRWQSESNYSTVDISFDNEWSESGELLLHLGGDTEEVAEVKAQVMELVNSVARCWEALPLPPHTGGYFSRTLSGKLPGKFAVEDDILHIRGNAGEREKMKKALEDLLPTVLSKQLQVDNGRLRSMIIGKEGVNIKRLRQNTSVDVHVGKDPDTTVRIAGATADVELVYSRLKAFIQEHRQICREVRLLPHAGRFAWRRLKTIGCEAEAFLKIPREAENLVEIRGNQRQVDHAEELLQEALYLDFSLIKLRISKRLKSDVLLGKNGVHIKEIKGERDVEIQFEDSTDESSMQDCVVSGQPDDCKSVLDEMLKRLGYEVVSMPVDSRTAGLIIGKGGANIKSLQEGLQMRAETRGNPWVIIGPKHDVREFLLRVSARFGVSTALAGQDTCRFVCPGCGLDFPSWKLMLAHVRHPPAVCPARSCIACDCGAVYADGPSCRKHEALCKKVQRCPGCGKAFASQTEVADHVKSEGCHARACSGCHQIFTDPEALQSHQLTCEKYLERQRNQEVRTQIRSLKIALCAQCRLGEHKGSSCPKCKVLLRKAQLQWHPDKNPQNEIVATIIFRSVQAVWDGEPQWLADEGRQQRQGGGPGEGASGHHPERQTAPAPFPSDCCVQ